MTLDSLAEPISIQPLAITSPSLPETTTTALPSTTAETSRPSTATYPPVKVRLRKRTNGTILFFNDIFVLIWIGLRVVPVAVLSALGFVVLLGLSFASLATTGTIAMLIGNAILRAAHLPHYTSNPLAAYIGAVGCLISIFIIALFMPFIPKQYDEEGNESIAWYFQLPISLLLSTLSGTIGSAVLLHNHVDLRGMDVLHATRAGALGGIILGIGSIFILPLVYTVLFMVIFSPLWIAISMGAQWVYVRSNEEWTDRSHSYSYCYCYGTRGDDPEINAELEGIQAPRMTLYHYREAM